jgi:trigger factor
VAVPEADIEATLKRLGEANPDIKDAVPGRAAEKGDVLNIDFVGTVDGATFQGGTAAGFHIRLGSGQFIPGFEDQLLGAKAGEKRDVNVTFPADYGAANLAGKAAIFSCVVNEVKPAVPAAIDDKLAEKAGLKNLGELRDQVRKQMEGDYGSVTRMRLKRQLLDKLAEAHGFAVPESMVESEFAGIWQQIEAQKKAGQLDEADAKKPEDELKAEYRKIAERRVRLGLLLAEVGKRNKIEVSQQELGQAIVRDAQRYPGQERKVIDFYQKNEAALAQLRAPIFEDKVVDYILELAKVAEKSVSPAELQAIGEADEKAA